MKKRKFTVTAINDIAVDVKKVVDDDGFVDYIPRRYTAQFEVTNGIIIVSGEHIFGGDISIPEAIKFIEKQFNS